MYNCLTDVTEDMIQFVQTNLKTNKVTLRSITITDETEDIRGAAHKR